MPLGAGIDVAVGPDAARGAARLRYGRAMIDNVEALRAAVRAGQTFRYELFWGHHPAPGGRVTAACLSQWWACAFTLDGVAYASTEQWMMAGKARLFGDEAALAAILAADDPAAVKKLGRTVRGFDEARWRAECFALVTRGNVAKFGQDPALKAFLLGTGDAVLVEASPFDDVWGIGLGVADEAAADPLRWEGENLLGFALMRARETLRGAA
ncbi:MAG: hypothetical protein JWM10_203 [Myxococcaceae bacterium]|nr:hypothetical protein [Myxococcaceae bacterium]